MKILIACIGNIFLGDDGFGVEVARQLARRPQPEGVDIRDYGIRGLDLCYALLDPWDLVILVDAAPRGGPPGTIYIIEPELPASGAYPDPHDLNPVAVLSAVESMGGPRNPMLVVGCEPADLGGEEGRIGLTPPVEAAVVEAIGIIENLVSQTARDGSLSVLEPSCVLRSPGKSSS